MAGNQQNPIVANAQLRAALLATAPRFRKNLGAFVAQGLGSTTRIKLFNVGIITNLIIAASVPLTIGTATATASPRAPYNLISRVRVTDYDGTDRINISGFQLFVLDCIRARIPFGINNEGPITAGGSAQNGGIVTNPSTPLSVGNATLSFILEVPLAFDPESDLRGSILGQTAVGEMYLSIDTNTTLVLNTSLDAVYNGAATTTVVLNGVAGPSYQVYQEYLLPQAIGNALPIPVIDLQTVYEFVGTVRSSDNIAVNTEKLINYPNVRSVIGTYFNFLNGTVMSATDLNLIRLIANGNNVMQEFNQLNQQIRQRNYLEGDIAAGTYWFLHRSKPIETALFGNVQIGVTPNAANANAAWEIGYESFFTKGSALPGVNQG